MGAEYDIALFQRVRDGDPDAFDRLVTIHLGALVGFASSLVGSVDVAEDIVQESLTTVWHKRATLPSSGSPRAYLFTVVRHRALDVLKHERVRARARERLVADAGLRVSQDTTVEREADERARDALYRRQVRIVQAALATLPERQRSALALRYTRELKVAEVAAVLGVSVKAAEQLLVRAIRALRVAAATTAEGGAP